VNSDLGPNEPISETELRLIMSFLGDTIAAILNPEHQDDDEQ
jgi:hypothetical protein